MSTVRNQKRGKPEKFGPHEPWKGAAVLWVIRGGVMHVARSSATMFTKDRARIVSKILCGGASTFWPVGDTWYSQRRQGKRFCRKCIARLRLTKGAAAE